MNEELLSIIEKNSKIGLKDLAVMLNLSEETVLNELETFEKEGITLEPLISVKDFF